MKELSIKEKAKRYDLAIEAAKCIYNNMKEGGDFGGMEDLEVIFSELKESEDEKVEKAIFGTVYDSDDELWSSYDVSKSDVLAWLEKQNPNANKEYWRGYREGKQEILDKYAELEKQREPTDVNPSEFDLRLNKLLKQFEILPKEELASSLNFYLNVVQNDGTYREEKQGEQKPVISDDALKEGIAQFGITQYQIDNWLKKYVDVEKQELNKVSQRIISAEAKEAMYGKLAEWSEENERMYKSITYSFAHNFPLTVQQQEFVKSLRLQKGWKPSNEQMSALEYYMHALICNEHKEILFGLYADLKKLK